MLRSMKQESTDQFAAANYNFELAAKAPIFHRTWIEMVIKMLEVWLFEMYQLYNAEVSLENLFNLAMINEIISRTGEN